MQRSDVTLSLEPELLSRLDQIGQENDITRSAIIKRFIYDGVRQTEWEKIRIIGKRIKKKFNLKNEDDLVRFIND